MITDIHARDGQPRPAPVLRTARLALDRITEDDAAFILTLLNEPSFLQFIGDRGVRTLDDARAYIAAGPVASYDAHGFGLYLVRRTADDAPVGMCGLLRRPTLDDADVGFAFLPSFWGQGYAREAAAAVLTHAKRDFGLTRLVAIVSPGNTASTRLLDALGLRYEETRRLTPQDKEVQIFGCTL